MGVIRVLGKEGDVETPWRPGNKLEVQKAREEYRLQRSLGLLAFETDPITKEGRQLYGFKEEAEEIVFMRQHRGG